MEALIMELSLYRDAVWLIEPRLMRAETYHLGRLLQAASPGGVVFVPIRSMQFLAILDAQEWVFVDGEKKHQIELAWQNFKPQTRHALAEPVPFDVAFYSAASVDLMPRLASALYAALVEATRRAPKKPRSAKVLPFKH
jgi:hypothetical protein